MTPPKALSQKKALRYGSPPRLRSQGTGFEERPEEPDFSAALSVDDDGQSGLAIALHAVLGMSAVAALVPDPAVAEIVADQQLMDPAEIDLRTDEARLVDRLVEADREAQRVTVNISIELESEPEAVAETIRAIQDLTVEAQRAREPEGMVVRYVGMQGDVLKETTTLLGAISGAYTAYRIIDTQLSDPKSGPQVKIDLRKKKPGDGPWGVLQAAG